MCIAQVVAEYSVYCVGCRRIYYVLHCRRIHCVLRRLKAKIMCIAQKANTPCRQVVGKYIVYYAGCRRI